MQPLVALACKQVNCIDIISYHTWTFFEPVSIEMETDETDETDDIDEIDGEMYSLVMDDCTTQR